MGYSDDQVRRLCREAIAEGFTHFKVKVGADPADDARRVGLVRDDDRPRVPADDRREPAMGRRMKPSSASARWRGSTSGGSKSRPVPDDVLGHAAIARAVAPVGVATGEHCANRVLFKQLLQAGAISFCQIDSCRLGGVNENLAVILMAAKFGVPVCPHAGGVGLCELVQHLSMWDFLSVSGAHGRSRHRVRRSPARALRRSGRDPRRPLPGAGRARLQQHDRAGESREAFRFPDGPVWTALRQEKMRHA